MVMGRRTKTSLIPPNVSSLKEIGKLQSAYPQAHPEIFSKMKSFYARIPKGPAPLVQRTGLYNSYRAKYLEKNTFMPILHFIGVMLPVGYYLSYFKGGVSVGRDLLLLDVIVGT
jgi:F-type H+-transporting ATPase subunit f